jgi:polysaccharide pyruvyl transferase WcaK-like protein
MSDIVIKGGYGLRNFGDDALMYYLIKSIECKVPGAIVSLDCKKAKYITNWLPNISFAHPYQVPKKVYVYGGGTLYYSFPKKIEAKSLWEKVKLALSSPSLVGNKLLANQRKRKFENSNVKKVMLGLGFGPFHLQNKQYEQAIIDVRSTDVVCVRDTKSFEFVNAHKKGGFHGTDICFAKGIVNNNASNRSEKITSIGVIIRDWNYGTEEDNYKDNLLQAVALLRKNNYIVQFVVFSDLRDKDWISTLKHCNEDYITWNPDNNTIESFMDQLNLFDLFISARFHGIIFSSLLNKPAISIAIEPKLELVRENAICKVWQPINGTKEELLNLVNEYNDEYKQSVIDCQDLVEKKSKRCAEMLDFAFKDLM